ncbi:MAG: cytochrome c biogenesis protein CcsA [Planctomycetota bacterium]|nr:cytochrome c biogenesis protein CcsA [Planctomycetota bacterium]
MATLLTFVNWLLPLAYLAVAADYAATFILRTRTHVRNPALAGVIVLHAAFLTAWGLHAGVLPLGEIHEILSLIALSSAILYAVIEFTSRDRRAGVFILLLVFLIQYTASVQLAGPIARGRAAAIDESGGLHVIPAIFAYTAIAFAAVCSVLYLAGQRALKRHSFGVLFDRLPPLDLLGTMSWHALLTGFLLTTITMITGALLFRHMGGHARGGAFDVKVTAKIVTGSIAWAACLTAILGKTLFHWPLRRVCQFIVGTFVVILALFAASWILTAA